MGVLVLATPAAASAHLSINPSQVHTGALVDLDFSVPNIGDTIGIDHVTLGIPQDFDLDDVEAKPTWTQSRQRCTPRLRCTPAMCSSKVSARFRRPAERAVHERPASGIS